MNKTWTETKENDVKDDEGVEGDHIPQGAYAYSEFFDEKCFEVELK